MNTILIADGEHDYRQQIRQHIGNRSGFRVIGECCNTYETIRHVNALEPDVLFLDMQLAGDKAFDLIKQTNHLPEVIYTARSESYAAQAFDHHALDYLLKPYGEARLDVALQKVTYRTMMDDAHEKARNTTPFRQHLFVEDDGRLKRIAMRDIRYLKAAGDYTVIYTENGEFVSSSGIGSIERKLDTAVFVRVHRSFIVNIACIGTCYRDIGKHYLVMENGQEISVGKHYLNNIKALIL